MFSHKLLETTTTTPTGGQRMNVLLFIIMVILLGILFFVWDIRDILKEASDERD